MEVDVPVNAEAEDNVRQLISRGEPRAKSVADTGQTSTHGATAQPWPPVNLRAWRNVPPDNGAFVGHAR